MLNRFNDMIFCKIINVRLFSSEIFLPFFKRHLFGLLRLLLYVNVTNIENISRFKSDLKLNSFYYYIGFFKYHAMLDISKI